MQCSGTQTQEQIIDMKRSDFFIVIIPFYSWVSHNHEGPQNFSKSSQIARYQDTRGFAAGLHSQVTGTALWKEWQGTGSRSHPDCLDPSQRLEMHITNVIQKGTFVQLPYELWERV